MNSTPSRLRWLTHINQVGEADKNLRASCDLGAVELCLFRMNKVVLNLFYPFTFIHLRSHSAACTTSCDRVLCGSAPTQHVPGPHQAFCVCVCVLVPGSRRPGGRRPPWTAWGSARPGSRRAGCLGCRTGPWPVSPAPDQRPSPSCSALPLQEKTNTIKTGSVPDLGPVLLLPAAAAVCMKWPRVWPATAEGIDSYC